MRKTLVITFFVLLLGVVFNSCMTARRINYLQEPNSLIPAYVDTVSYSEYQLRIGDCLYIRVHSLDNEIDALLNGGVPATQQAIMYGTSSTSDLFTYTVKPNGTISFPIAGTLLIQGKSTRDVKELLEQKLGESISSCSVDVRVVKRFFSIIGAGVSGRYPIQKEKINVFEALAMAGDIHLYGDRSKIRIVREGGKKTEIKFFDIRSADILHSEFYYIEPNDVIYIQTMNEQFFSMTSFPIVLSTAISTFSFGILIYNSFLKPTK